MRAPARTTIETEGAGMAYATSAEYEAYTGGTAPANITLLLNRASRDVDQALLAAVYPVDDGGLPTEAAHIVALREATIEQVAAWAEIGETGTGTSERYDDVQIGSVRLARRLPQTGAGGGSAARPLTSQARSVLQLAGLTNHGPYTYPVCTEAADG